MLSKRLERSRADGVSWNQSTKHRQLKGHRRRHGTLKKMGHWGAAVAVAVLLCGTFLFRHFTVVKVTVESTEQSRKPKHILYYTTYWGALDFSFGEGRTPFIDTGCPVNDCFITSNRSYLQSLSLFDALVYHAHVDSISFQDYLLAQKLRTAKQRHILMALESPMYTNRRIPYRTDRQQFPYLSDARDLFGNENVTDPYDNYFHWTMSYRWDSDLPRPYGRFQHRSSPTFLPTLPHNWEPYNEQLFLSSLASRPKSFWALAKRRKKVAWIVSDCSVPSNRDQYVKELAQYIQVDIFGECGDMSCDGSYNADFGGLSIDNCSATVQRDYKFYLSFENAYCNDYATEKFFGRVEHNLVVVMGQANYTRLAPPHSHLNVQDFSSPKELASLLHSLDRDDDQYLSYFWWRDFYQVFPTHFSKSQRDVEFDRTWCHLCGKLHENEVNVATYTNLQDWWSSPSECNRLNWGGANDMMRLDRDF